MNTRARPALAEVNANPYTLDSVTRCESPVVDDNRAWHRYIISQGENRIFGQQPGSAENVRCGAEEIVGKLNQRRLGAAGRSNIRLGTTRKQP